MDKELIAIALNQLIKANNYATLKSRVNTCIEDWETMPMLFSGALAPLNSLIDLGLHSRSALEKLWGVVESKRAVIPQVKKVDYQREFMAERRQRLMRALRIEEATRGKKLTPEGKKKYIERLQKDWMKARNTYIKGLGDLTWAQRNEAAREFWKGVDAGLDKEYRKVVKE